MTSTDTCPMPDLHCPAWCDRDHLPDWEQHVAVGLDTHPSPAAGGGHLPDSRGPLPESPKTYRPLHVRTLGRIDLSRNARALIDIPHGAEEPLFLYIDAQGAITSEQARRYAAELLDAANMLDG